MKETWSTKQNKNYRFIESLGKIVRNDIFAQILRVVLGEEKTNIIESSWAPQEIFEPQDQITPKGQ